MKSWKILETPPASATENMSFDSDLLKGLEFSAQPVLHFYEWNGPSATYGHFIDPFKYLNSEGVARERLQLGRRPTGGGIIFHVSDFAFSAVVPASHPKYSMNTLENYAFINQAVAAAVKEFLKEAAKPSLLAQEKVPEDESLSNFCMAHPTKYDVVIEGKKVGGAAQRRTKFGYLHQGSIALAMPSQEFLSHVLLKDSAISQAMCRHTYSLLGTECTQHQLQEGKALLRHLLQKHL